MFYVKIRDILLSLNVIGAEYMHALPSIKRSIDRYKWMEFVSSRKYEPHVFRMQINKDD